MDGDPRSTKGPGELVLELFRKDDPDGDAPFSNKLTSYVRPRAGDVPLVAAFEWGKALKAALGALLRGDDQDLDAVHKAAEMGQVLGRFLTALRCDDLAERIARQDLSESDPVLWTLRLGAAELFAVPWELTRFGPAADAVGRNKRLLLRYEQLGARATVPPPVEPPPEGGRILFAWSDAGGPVDQDGHLRALAESLGLSQEQLPRAHTVLSRASLQGIREALAACPDDPRGAAPTVLHLLCHGGMRSYPCEGGDTLCSCIVLHDEQGKRAEVTPDALRAALSDFAGSLRLVVLSVCHGGSWGEVDNTLGSPAQQLHLAGIEAVVAARYFLPIPDSIELTRCLYGGLVRESRSLEEALLAVRGRLRETPLRWSNLLLFAREADGPEHRPLVRCPYRGLKRFEEKDAGWFFGRSAEVRGAVQKLARLVDSWTAPPFEEEGDSEDRAPERLPRLLLVSGATGAGKSSFVRAGVVPAWLASRRKKGEDWQSLKVERPSPATLGEALGKRTSARALLVLDQLEDLFASGVAKAEREELIREVYRLASDPDPAVTVIATVRVDYLDRLGEIRVDAAERTLEEIAQDPTHGLPLFRMKSAAIREIIEAPAARAGVRIEGGLTDRILADVGDSPGAQPLVEYVLKLLWEKRRRQGGTVAYELTHAAYDAIGGLSGALDRRAEEVFLALDDVRRRAAKRILVQLVEVNALRGMDRRRRVLRSRLSRGPADEAAVFDDVLEKLDAEQLVVVDEVVERDGRWERGDEAVELAHDQILRAWDRLRRWLDDDRNRKLDLQRLERWTDELSDTPDAVLDGVRLARARAVLAELGPELRADVRALIERSVTAEEAAQRRELDHLRRNRSLGIINNARECLSIGEPGAAALLLAEVTDPAASGPRGLFGRVAREVLDAGIPLLTMRHQSNVTCAALVGTGRLAAGTEEGAVLLWSLDRPVKPFDLSRQPVTAIAADRSGSFFAAGSRDGAARVFEVGDRAPVALEAHPGPICSVGLDPDSGCVLTASVDGTLRLSDIKSGAVRLVLRDPELSRGLRGAMFTPDGQRILALDGQGGCLWWSRDGERVARWPAGSTSAAWISPDRLLLGREDGALWLVREGREEPQILESPHTGRVHVAVASADGMHAVTAAGMEWRAVLWRMDSTSGVFKPMRRLDGHEGMIAGAQISPDGQRVATGSADATVRIHRVDGAEPARVLRCHQGSARPLAWSPGPAASRASVDSREWIVTGSESTKALLWSLDGSPDPLVLTGHSDTPTALAWSPDGRRLLTGANDRTARIWALAGAAEEAVLAGHEAKVTAVAWSPDGRLAAAGAEDGSVRVWRAPWRDPPVLLKGRGSPVRALAWSPDGRRIACAHEDGATLLRSPNGAAQEATLAGPESAIASVAWSPDGTRLVTACADGAARVWSVDVPGEPLVVLSHEGPLTGALFHPEGAHILTTLAAGMRLWRADGRGDPQSVMTTGSARSAVFDARDKAAPASILAFLGDMAVVEVRSDTGRFAPVPWFTPLVRLGVVTAAAFSPDLVQLAVASDDRAVRVCAFGAELLRQRLSEATWDCLLPEERQFWLGEARPQAEESAAACEARSLRRMSSLKISYSSP